MLLTFPAGKLRYRLTVCFGVFASMFWITGMAVWIVVAVVVSKPPNGSKWKSCYKFSLPFSSSLTMSYYVTSGNAETKMQKLKREENLPIGV